MNGKPITRLMLPLLILVIALAMSLEGAYASKGVYASITPGMPYGESQPLGGDPSAYYYNGRTYVTWQGRDLDPYVAYYDSATKTKTWTGPVRVGDNPLTNNDHGAPVIMVDNSGYIHVMYGCRHGWPVKYAKSTNPEDISAWTVMPDPVSATGGSTYLHMVKDLSGNLYLVYLGYGGGEGSTTDVEDIIKSTDGGTTWGAPQDIVNLWDGEAANNDIIYMLMGGVDYQPSTNRINVAWLRYNGTSLKRENAYYAYLNLADNNMYSVSGTNLGTTITLAEADANCKAVSTNAVTSTNFITVRVDSTGAPYLIYDYVIRQGAWTYRYNFTRWTGAAWSTPVVITTTDDDSNPSEFFVNSSTDIEAYLVGSGNPGRGGDIERWSWDGSTWSKVSTILRQADVGTHGLNMPLRVYNGVDLRIVFTEVNVDWPTIVDQYTISNLRIFAYSPSD
jgi:hypothetical protein